MTPWTTSLKHSTSTNHSKSLPQERVWYKFSSLQSVTKNSYWNFTLYNYFRTVSYHHISMFRILLSNVLKVVKKLKKNKKSNGSIFKNHTIAHFMHSNKILFYFTSLIIWLGFTICLRWLGWYTVLHNNKC